MSWRTWRWDGNWLVEDTDHPHGWEMVLYYSTADDGLHGDGKDKALIAAAPEILEALKALCSWITDEVEIDGCDVPTYAARLKAAQSAIAKAEGRS